MSDPRTGTVATYKTEIYQDGAPYGYYPGEPVAGLLHFLNTVPGVKALHIVHDGSAIHAYYEDAGCAKRIETPMELVEVKK
jgi:hypothetical protein